MAELAENPNTPPPLEPSDGQTLLQRLSLGATAYIWGSNFLHLVTKGGVSSPDRWENIYLVILAAYEGGQEVRSWAKGAEPGEPNPWQERIRKGGPLTTAWVLLLFLAGILRQVDASFPMPEELESITIKVIGLFLGTYVFRPYRCARPLGRRSNEDDTDALWREKISATLRDQGPKGSRALSDALDIPPRTLARLLKGMLAQRILARGGSSPNDPSATYRIK